MFIKKVIRKLNLRLNQVEDRGLIKIEEMGEKIPKIIHQTYLTRNVNSDIETNIKNLRNANPDWEYRFYDDNDITIFIETNFPEILKFYNKINPKYGAARADLFRYLLMYKDGGAYLDIKSTLAKPLDEILSSSDQYILAHWEFSHNSVGRHTCINNTNGEYQQWHIICVKGHPFLKAVIENVCKNIDLYNPLFHDVAMMGVLRTTGPIAYSLSILPIVNLHKHRAGFDNDFGLIYSIFSNGFEGHKTLFTTHYHDLKESIITQSTLVELIFSIFRPLKDKLKNNLLNQNH